MLCKTQRVPYLGVISMSTVKQIQSAASRKGWRSRKAMAAARAASTRRTVGYDAVMAATTDDKSSAVIAAELGVTAAYVRCVWRLKGLPPREVGKRPRLCATTERPVKG